MFSKLACPAAIACTKDLLDTVEAKDADILQPCDTLNAVSGEDANVGVVTDAQNDRPTTRSDRPKGEGWAVEWEESGDGSAVSMDGSVGDRAIIDAGTGENGWMLDGSMVESEGTVDGEILSRYSVDGSLQNSYRMSC